MVCPNCGTATAATDTACPICGAPVAAGYAPGAYAPVPVHSDPTGFAPSVFAPAPAHVAPDPAPAYAPQFAAPQSAWPQQPAQQTAWPQPPAPQAQWPQPPAPQMQPGGYPSGQYPTYPGINQYGFPTAPKKAVNNFSIAAIVLGCVAVLVSPLMLGPAAIVLAAVAKKHDEPRSTLALIIAIAGTAVGLAFSALIALL